MDYKLKYLKYRAKYLNLKKEQSGGVFPPELILKVTEFMTDEEKIIFMTNTVGVYKEIMLHDLPELKDKSYSITEITETALRPWRLIDRFKISNIDIRNLDELNILSAILSPEQCNAIKYLTFGFRFNQPLNNSLDKLTNLTYLTFGDNFNQPLNNSLDNLKNLQYLTFGRYFNQPLNNSLEQLINLKILTFGFSFNQPLDNSLANLKKLKIIILPRIYNIVIPPTIGATIIKAH